MAALLSAGANSVAYHLEKSRFAYAELETYLTLSSNTYRLFKQLRRDLIDKDGNIDFALQQAHQTFEKRLGLLQQQILEDQKFRAAEKRFEKNQRQLARLSALTEEIRRALDDVVLAQAMFARGEGREGMAFLSNSFEQRIDRRVSKLLDEGIHFERLAAAAAQDEVQSIVSRLSTAAWLMAIGAAGFGLILGLILLRQVARPLRLLSAGTIRFAGGNLSHRIPVAGRDEFAGLAQNFNDMAEQIAAKRNAIDQLNNELERKIIVRTAELERTNKALNEKEDIRRKFFADVGHELRTPITIIRGEAEVALRAKGDTQGAYRKALSTIAEYSAHLTQLVADIFVIARSDAGRLQFRREVVDLAALVRKAAIDLEQLPANSQQKLLTDIPAEKINILGDQTRLLQLLMILIDNAARHAGHGANVNLRLAMQGGEAVLTVADNGQGIPAEELPHVFDRFACANPGNVGGSGGAGLGLSLARAITRGHDGRITVDSKLAIGTTITVAIQTMPEFAVNLDEA